MEDEIDDIVGEIKYTDSQKSIAASLVEFNYSVADTASASYGHETYTLDIQGTDESDAESPRKTPHFHYIQPALAHSTQRTILQETFTQTSKTIIQLAENDRLASTDCKQLDTQTSTVSITENKSIQYRIEYSSSYPTSRRYERQLEMPYKAVLDSNYEQPPEKDSTIPNISSLDAGYETNLERQLEAPYCNSREEEYKTQQERKIDVMHVTTVDAIEDKNNEKQFLSLNYDLHLTEQLESPDAQSPRTSFDDDSSKYHCQDTDRTVDSSNNEDMQHIDEPELERKYSQNSCDEYNGDMERDSLIEEPAVTQKFSRNLRETNHYDMEPDSLIVEPLVKQKNGQNARETNNSFMGPGSLFEGSELERIKSRNSRSDYNSNMKRDSLVDNERQVRDLQQIEKPDRRQKSSRSSCDKYNYDMEPDSLTGRHSTDSLESDMSVPKSVDDDVVQLYTKLSGNIDLRNEHNNMPDDTDLRKTVLSPLTEESLKRERSSDVNVFTPTFDTQLLNSEDFQTFNGLNVKMLAEEKDKERHSKESFKLPPIRSTSNPNSSTTSNNLSLLFSSSKNFGKTDGLPSLQEMNQGLGDMPDDRIMAGGECCKVSSKAESPTTSVQLPPIRLEGTKTRTKMTTNPATTRTPREKDSITIKDKIQELKGGAAQKARSWKSYSKRHPTWAPTRSSSPSSCESPVRSEVAERGCDALCSEICRKLRYNQNWEAIVETLDEMLNSLQKYWNVISEQRTADLIRQVCVHVECPRTLVARAACNSLAGLIKNTGYTKKPDFYEAISLLLSKTGSYSRPIRRAANVALDVIVSGVDVCHSISALTLHGVTHKSPLVRVCVSRLLVVVCALSAGGRCLLRPRPPQAALARRAALNALSTLLDDKHYDARKYAERLYLMLRPLPNFESYFLTDVNAEIATRQIKKYDQMLMFGLVTKTQSR